MAKEIVNANAKIHVLADETLGGIKREYVEVDRKAEVGDKPSRRLRMGPAGSPRSAIRR